MNFHQAIEFVEDSKVFKSFFFDNKDFHLVHGFLMIENGKRTPWQVGYYSKKADRIVVFTAEDEVSKSPEEEAFKKDGLVPALDASNVKTSNEDVLSTAEKVRAEKHPHELVTKTIVILQSLDGVPTWNITLVTQAFSLVNIRIDASSGDLITQSASSIMNLGKRT